MADILCLKGDAAFSAFRLQRLLARLNAAVGDIEAVTADYWHVVAQKRALSADERAKLAQLLEEVLDQGLFLRIHLDILAMVVSPHMGCTVRLRKGASVKPAFFP